MDQQPGFRPCGAWLPQLRQLSAAAAVALRRQVADSPDRETARSLTEGMVFLLVGRGGFPQDRGDLGLQPCQP
jgi:hypothetical protein